ncbi:MAG: M28 family peptidase [Flavobacteriaceae bacterium]|nr:M28 family peptidase [Flavobacteriaceae bacterium]
MKNNITIIIVLLFVLCSCKRETKSKIINNTISSSVRISFDSITQIESLKILSSDSYLGRETGTKGAELSRNYIADKFTALKLDKLGGSYFQSFPYNGSNDHGDVKEGLAYNVIGLIRGREQSNKFIVVGAHYDHLGTSGKKVYNGADDNASGTAALFSIATYFKENPPKHSIIIAAWDGEEIGLLGSQYYVNHPIILQKDILCNINMDMIGRSEKNELFITGTPHNKLLMDSVVTSLYSNKIKILTGHDGDDREDDWTYSSDHGSFHKKGIPFLYFGVEDHKDYHKTSDVFESIQQAFYLEATRVVIQATKRADECFTR